MWITLKLVDSVYSTRDGYVKLYACFMPLLLVLNVAVEAGVVSAICKLRFNWLFAKRLFTIHLLTWGFGALLFAPMGGAARRSGVARVLADMRWLGIGLEAYHTDNGVYPPAGSLSFYATAGGNQDILASSGGDHLTTIDTGGRERAGITTPVAYITSLFPDIFAPRGVPIAYYADANGWILYSAGPDRHYDIDPPRDYNSSETQLSRRLIEKRYDPTNGVLSKGDLLRVKDHPQETPRPQHEPTTMQKVLGMLNLREPDRVP